MFNSTHMTDKDFYGFASLHNFCISLDISHLTGQAIVRLYMINLLLLFYKINFFSYKLILARHRSGIAPLFFSDLGCLSLD